MNMRMENTNLMRLWKVRKISGVCSESVERGNSYPIEH